MNSSAITTSVIPYRSAAARAPSSRMCSAMSRVGNGANATSIRKAMFRNRNTRSVRSICDITVWWFTQTIPMVKKVTAYAA